MIGTENLLVASAVVITLCAGLATYLYPETATATTPVDAAPASGHQPALSAVQIVSGSPHLRAISVILTLTIVVSTVVDW